MTLILFLASHGGVIFTSLANLRVAMGDKLDQLLLLACQISLGRATNSHPLVQSAYRKLYGVLCCVVMEKDMIQRFLEER